MKTFTVNLGKNAPQLLNDPEHEEIKYFDVLLTFKEAAKLEPGNANVRLPKRNARTIKAMLNTVENAPQQFHLKNRGITYHCLNAELKNGELTISIPEREGANDPNKFGILDGGHTKNVIDQVVEHLEQYKNITGWAIPFVRVRFLVNIPENMLPAVVEGLNTSLQVKETSLSEYRNEFEWYKETLRKLGWKPDTTSYKEGVNKDWNITEINQRATLFLKSVWLQKQPIDVYKSSGRALRMFLRDSMKEEYEKLENVLIDAVTFPEFITSRLDQSGLLEGKVIERMEFVKRLKKPERRVNTDYPTRIRLNDGITLPMAAAFRELLHMEDGKYSWEVPYQEVFELVKEELVNVMVKRLKAVGLKISSLANDQGYWYDCQNIVLRGKERYKNGERAPKGDPRQMSYEEVEEPAEEAV